MSDRVSRVKAALMLSELVGRFVDWDRRKSNPAQGDFWACCPFHQERTASFHVDDKRGFFHCFGCSAGGDLFDFQQQYFNQDFAAALEALEAFGGVAPGAQPRARARPRDPAPPGAQDRARRALFRAREIWRQARPGGRLIMDYLAARGVAIAALERTFAGLPPAIRLHPELAHFRDGAEVHRGPAMIGLVSWPRVRGKTFGRVVGIHRTWITARGRQALDGIKLDKQWLGLTGSMKGAACHLAPVDRQMLVGEGIETTLAAWSLKQLEFLGGHGPYWGADAALSLDALAGRADRSVPDGGMPDMAAPGWLAPERCDRLLILGEGSPKDPKRAEARAACALRRHRVRRDRTLREVKVWLTERWRWTPDQGISAPDDFADVAAGLAAVR